MRFEVLGTLQARDRQGQPLPLGSPKQRAVLAVLLVHANQTVPVADLIDAVWEHDPPATARHSIQVYVHKLRRAFAQDGDREVLVARQPGYRLLVGSDELDAELFERLGRQARDDAAAGRHEEAVTGYERALRLWQGPALAEFAGAAFARPLIARLGALRLAARVGRAEALVALGRYADAVPELEELTQLYPLQERLWWLLIVALDRSGRQADALAAYQSARRVLVEELGIEPGPELVELERAVLAREASAPGPVPESAQAEPQTAAAVAAPSGARFPSADASRRDPVGEPVRTERRIVTILVVEVPIVRRDDADPETLFLQHGGFFQRVAQEAVRCGGILHAQVGTTAVVAFGALRTQHDDPDRAVRAALAIVDLLPGPSAARIGIDTGEVVVTAPAGQGGVQLTGPVVAATMHLASLAAPGAVLVGETAYRSTRRAGDYRWLDPPQACEGVARRLMVAEPRDDGETATPRLIGRERELRLLRELAERAWDEREPQLVTIVGAPGVGKTRLIRELSDCSLTADEVVGWYQGRSPPYGDGVTYWAFAEIVKAQAGIDDADSAAEAERKLARAVAAALGEEGEADRVAGYLLPLVRPATALGVQAGWRREAFAAWRTYLEALACRRRLVLVVEDLHWADDALLDFVEYLTDQAEAVPLLIVCAAWPELLDRRSGWGGGTRNATTISLGPLSAPYTERLLDELLDELPLPAGPRAQLLAGSGGNPLFVEEYVRMLRDRVDVAGSAGQLDGLAPPETVQLLIGARLDSLPAVDRALLADAAVFGEVVWSGAIAAISGVDRNEVEAALRGLARREYLRRSHQSGISQEVEYVFRHVLIQRVAYGRLLRGDRADRHRRAAEWLEGLGADRVADRAELIAHHYQQALTYAVAGGQRVGDLHARAAQALWQAGRRASALAAFSSAVRYYDQALAIWPADDPERVDRLLICEQIRDEIDQEVDESALREARDLLLAKGDYARAVRAQSLLSLAGWFRRRTPLDPQEERIARFVRAAPPSREKMRALVSLAGARLAHHYYDEAAAVATEALALAREYGAGRAEAIALGTVGTARVVRGDLGGLADVRSCVSSLDEHRSSFAPLWYAYFASTILAVGDLHRYGQMIAAGRPVAERFGAKSPRYWVESAHVGELYCLGRWDEALDRADRLIAELEHGRWRHFEAWCRCWRAKIRLARSDLEGARDDAAVAMRLTRDLDDNFRIPAIATLTVVLAAVAEVAGDDSAREEAAGLVSALAKELAGGLIGHLVAPITGVELPELFTRLELHGQPQGPPPLHIEDTVAAALPWLDALREMLLGRPDRAAGVYAGIGSRPDEAIARLRTGQRLAAEGRRAEAERQLTAARRFFEDARASFWLRQLDPGEPGEST